MEMSAKLLPIGFSSPAILLCFILAFKADATYHSFITSSGICWKDWFQKSLSEYVTVSIALSLFDEFYPAKRREFAWPEKETARVWKMLNYSTCYLKISDRVLEMEFILSEGSFLWSGIALLHMKIEILFTLMEKWWTSLSSFHQKLTDINGCQKAIISVCWGWRGKW